VRKVLLVIAAVSALAAGAAGTAGATGRPSGATTPPVATSGFIPDPGVTITTDPSKAPAGKTLIATGARVVSRAACATCGAGGGNVQGCATAYTNNGDGFGNWVRSYYHWCWLNGSVSSNYGWGDEAACFAACSFEGWNYNLDFSYGHRDKGTFRDVQVPFGIPIHYDSSDATCVQVDGWGNVWGC